VSADSCGAAEELRIRERLVRPSEVFGRLPGGGRSVPAMSDAAGPFHVTVNADVRVTNPGRLGGADETRMAEALAQLIRGHAWEAGLEITDPASVQVSITR
jgi:hypothetical protein